MQISTHYCNTFHIFLVRLFVGDAYVIYNMKHASMAVKFIIHEIV